MPNLRQAIRRAINRSTGLATAPLRSLAAATLRRRPELTARSAEWSWLWQPSWGKSMQQSLFSSGIDPYDRANECLRAAEVRRHHPSTRRPTRHSRS